jgi:hypothetical protein
MNRVTLTTTLLLGDLCIIGRCYNNLLDTDAAYSTQVLTIWDDTGNQDAKREMLAG